MEGRIRMNTGGRAVNRIEKRAIEAQAIAPLIRAVAERIGWDDALEILTTVNRHEALERGRDSRELEANEVIGALAEEVEGWGDGDVLEKDVVELTPMTYFFDVTRCPYHEKYLELGLEALGVALSCCRDEPHARGFDSRLRLMRTKTLMEGADCCDFRYRLSAD